MKHFLPFQLLSWFFTCVTSSYSQSHSFANTREFNDSVIQPNLEKATYSLIYFYSDTCKYCHLFNPVFENLSTLYNKNDTGKSVHENESFQILKTNARVNKKLSKLFAIRHYPTLKLLHYPSKEILEYEGKRDLHSLIDYIESKTLIKPNYANFQSGVKDIQDPRELFRGEKEKVVIFIMSHMADWKDYHYPAHYIQSIANLYRAVDFYVCHGDDPQHAELLPQFGVSNFPSLVYIRSRKFKSLNTERLAYQTNYKFDGDKIGGFISSIDLDQSSWRLIEPVNEAQTSEETISSEENEENDDFDDIDDDDDDDIEHIEL
ncbi:hypothetical protein KGF57_000203 [Candida theae]|uniref:Thioredoxin domain-containing protein n=1 Tax=Candida theae TaxID=1198502 RepID=A0AAD5G109_9ASCO|nr:uncharacterized protein KGF57_000203 [Candida theae]KAI5968344.1 hypothetical protein KGF57_000203 [Candida theae]